MESTPRVTIIGAGLAGLSTAYHLGKLRSDASITIYESTARPGGRILTRMNKPRGEHGAEYILGSELSGRGEYCLSAQGGQKRIRDLFAELKVEIDESEIPSPAYFWNVRYSPRLRLNAFLDPKTAAQIRKIFVHAQKSAPHPRGMFKAWLNSNFSLSSAGIAFVDMLLAGETCAPSTSLTTSHALGCLNSSVSRTESWYRIKGGSQTLINAFAKKLQRKNVRFYFGTPVHRVICTQARPKVQTESQLPQESFDAVVITSPDGERLIRKKMIEFHSYISLLITCNGQPRVKGNNPQRLGGAVYLDSPLNFVQFHPVHQTLRVLLPIADPILRDNWSDETILSFSKYFLDQILKDRCLDYERASVQRWKYGLPCVGRANHQNQYVGHAGGILCAGDRFAIWPSMAGAIVSGSRAAEKVSGTLKQ